jgi:hypothetical protein
VTTAVVVLGDALESPEIHEELATRVDRGIERFAETDAEAMVVTGGAPSDVDRTEAAVMAAYAESRGFDADDLLVEDEALDTVGNAFFTRRLLDAEGVDADRIDLVTSDWHADRSRFVFERTFGDAAAVGVGARPEAPDPRDPAAEAQSFDLVRDFFAPVADGDLAGVRDRMVETHDLYDASDLPGSLTDRLAETVESGPDDVGAESGERGGRD